MSIHSLLLTIYTFCKRTEPNQRHIFFYQKKFLESVLKGKTCPLINTLCSFFLPDVSMHICLAMLMGRRHTGWCVDSYRYLCATNEAGCVTRKLLKISSETLPKKGCIIISVTVVLNCVIQRWLALVSKYHDNKGEILTIIWRSL